jgi:hypothetical protein
MDPLNKYCPFKSNPEMSLKCLNFCALALPIDENTWECSLKRIANTISDFESNFFETAHVTKQLHEALLQHYSNLFMKVDRDQREDEDRRK